MERQALVSAAREAGKEPSFGDGEQVAWFLQRVTARRDEAGRR